MASANFLGYNPSILIAECMGLLEGIKGVISLHIKKIVIEQDNITVIYYIYKA